MLDRDYAFTASGRGDKILNSTAYDRLENDVVNYLKQDDFLFAFETFVSTWEEYLVLAAKGRSYNFFTHNNTFLVIAAWVVSLIIGLTVIVVWRSRMNTAIPQRHADTYMVPGSMNFTKRQDRFLYSTISRVRRSSSSSSSSGGSSRSSGGRSSRSGKF